MHFIRVIHDTPGRLRLAVPGIAGSRARALACEDAVLALPGVCHAHANERTGNLLVLYRPGTLPRPAIEQRCRDWAEGAVSAAVAPAPEPEHRHPGSAGALGVMAHLLPHLLPLLLGSRMPAATSLIRRQRGQEVTKPLYACHGLTDCRHLL